MDKETVLYSHHGMLHSKENEQAVSTHSNIDGSHEHTLSKRSQTQQRGCEQHYSQSSQDGNKPKVHRQMKGHKKCGPSIQCNVIQP